MPYKHLLLAFACSAFLITSTAHADVLPPEDTGTADTGGAADDDGCAVMAPGAGGGAAALAFSALAVALVFRRRD